jgi:hypothetical protein
MISSSPARISTPVRLFACWISSTVTPYCSAMESSVSPVRTVCRTSTGVVANWEGGSVGAGVAVGSGVGVGSSSGTLVGRMACTAVFWVLSAADSVPTRHQKISTPSTATTRRTSTHEMRRPRCGCLRRS